MIDFREVTGVALAGGTKRNPDNMIEFDYSKTYPYGGGFLKDGLVRGGITFNIKEDGSIIMNGTSTAEFWLIFGDYTSVTPGSTYIFGANCPEVARYKIGLTTQSHDVDKNKLDAWDTAYATDGIMTRTIPENVAYINWRIHVWSGVTLNNVVFRPMFNEGETLNDYYLPITAWSDVENVYWTKRSPANIIPLPYSLLKTDGTLSYKPETETKYGVTATYNKDGSIKLNGINTIESGNINFYASRFLIPRSGIYRLPTSGANGAKIMVQIVTKNNDWVSNIANNADGPQTFTIPQEYVDNKYRFYIVSYLLTNTIGKEVDTTIYPILQYISTQNIPYYANKRNPKNLVDLGAIASKDTRGLIYDTKVDGSIHISGTLTKVSSSVAWRLPELELGKTYTYHLNASNYYDKTLTLAKAEKGFIQIYTTDESGYGKFVKNVGSQVNSTGFTFTVTEDMLQDGYYFRNNIYIYDGNIGTEGYEATSYDFICYPILNEGETAEPFYIE